MILSGIRGSGVLLGAGMLALVGTTGAGMPAGAGITGAGATLGAHQDFMVLIIEEWFLFLIM